MTTFTFFFCKKHILMMNNHTAQNLKYYTKSCMFNNRYTILYSYTYVLTDTDAKP